MRRNRSKIIRTNLDLPRREQVRYEEGPDFMNGPYSPRRQHNHWFPNKATQIRWYTDPVFHIYGNQRNKSDVNLFEYELLENPDEILNPHSKLKRASYIPYIRFNNDMFLLLGSFIDFPQIKVDFGGKCTYKLPDGTMRKDKNPYQCATRELNEETHGVLVDPVIFALNRDRATVYKGVNRFGDINFFILIEMTGHLKQLDEVQDRINYNKLYDPVLSDSPDEEFGPLGFHRVSEIYNGRDSRGNPMLFPFALTDFLSKVRIV